MINLIVTENYDALSRDAAGFIGRVLSQKSDAAIVFATGNTPMGAYAELAKMRSAGQLDASSCRPFQLDEYLGLVADDNRTLWGWMERSVVLPLALDPTKIVRLPCDTLDADASCRAYDLAVERAGRFDLAILGLGPNGHLAFNEPPADSDSPTRAITLSAESIESNSAYWGGPENVPPRAMTAGLKQILGARQILLLVSGAKKAAILQQVLLGPVSSAVPASFLQAHGDVTVIADFDAAGALVAGGGISCSSSPA